MKKHILLLLLFVTGISSYAQCDKKIILSSSASEHLNGINEVQNTDDRTTTMEYDSKAITITIDEYTLEGTVNAITCDWKTPYKEGKTVIKATMTRTNGEQMTTTITIEGKDGKNILVAAFDESPNQKLRLTLNKFEEKK